MKILPKQLSSESTKTSSFFPVFPPRFFLLFSSDLRLDEETAADYSSSDSSSRSKSFSFLQLRKNQQSFASFSDRLLYSTVVKQRTTELLVENYQAPISTTFRPFLCKQRAAAFFTLLRAAALTAPKTAAAAAIFYT